MSQENTNINNNGLLSEYQNQEQSNNQIIRESRQYDVDQDIQYVSDGSENFSNDLDEFEKRPLEKKRWLILFAFCTLTFTNASSFTTYSSILHQTEQYYNASQSQVIWITNIYYIIYVLGCLPTVFMWDWRFDINLYVSSFLNMSGGIIRYFSKDSYTGMMIGTATYCVSQLWLISAPAIIAERWFGSEEKIVALSIGFFSNVMGISYGYLSAAFSVDDTTDEKILNPQMEQYLMICSIINALPFLLCLIFVRNSPKVLPNIEDEQHVKLNMVQSLKKCYFDFKNFFSIFSLSLYLGISWTFQAVLDVILEDGYSVLDIGYIGLTMNTAGTLGGLFSSLYIEYQLKHGKKPIYDTFLKIFASLSFFMVIVFTIFLIFYTDGQHKWAVFIITGCIGLGFNAFVPLAAESMLETIYPVSEIVGFTIFCQAGNLIGLVGNLISSFGMWPICVIMLPLYIYLMFFYKTKHIRRKTEIQIKKQSFAIKQSFKQE